MGEPATPTASDRAATQQLAERIVQSVVDDATMPLDLHATPSGMVARWEVELLVFQLAQEVTLLRAELTEACVIALRRNRSVYSQPGDLDRIEELQGVKP